MISTLWQPSLATFILTNHLVQVFGILPPDFMSDWLLMQSQNTTNYVRDVDHGLGEIPLKVKVLVKPLRGPYTDWMFEASSSQQVDDDIPWLYCGILYTYTDTQVRLFAPRRNTQYDGGRAFCIDSFSWTSGYDSLRVGQEEQDVLAKVLAWKSSSFPAPDFDTGWIGITAKESPNFMEVAHNQTGEPALVHLQIRCVPLYTTETVYSEGVGSASNPTTSISSSVVTSGLIFGYDTKTVRIWAPNSGYACILCIRDGYARDSDGYRCQSGEFRIRGWMTPGNDPDQFRFTLTGIPADMSALKINIRIWNPLTSYITVLVKALDGPNANFVFPAIGQGQRNVYPSTTYGGVLFGYSADHIRIFVPANETGTMIQIPENWGTERYNQMSDNVEVIVTIWRTTEVNTCSDNQATVGKFMAQGNTTCPSGQWTKCTTGCLTRSQCVGVIRCPSQGDCQLMDLDAVNKRIVEGVLGREGELLLTRLVCAAR